MGRATLFDITQKEVPLTHEVVAYYTMQAPDVIYHEPSEACKDYYFEGGNCVSMVSTT